LLLLIAPRTGWRLLRSRTTASIGLDGSTSTAISSFSLTGLAVIAEGPTRRFGGYIREDFSRSGRALAISSFHRVGTFVSTNGSFCKLLRSSLDVSRQMLADWPSYMMYPELDGLGCENRPSALVAATVAKAAAGSGAAARSRRTNIEGGRR
ncbi:hypothetical protein KCU59_g158, partial [Aureobasidium melanogenum]